MPDIFLKQLDGCQYVSGGQNCTCACEGMWLYRASRGKVRVTSCLVRMRTGDKIGGTHLGQMEDVSQEYGITSGRVYRPIAIQTLVQLAATGRYGFIIQGSYSVIAGTSYDCFRGNFKGNHAWYVSGPGTAPGTWRVADPGADGRAPGIHTGYTDIPIALMVRAAAKLNVAQFGYKALGTGKAYVYITPPDPVVAKAPHYRAKVKTATALWNDSTKKWVYTSAPIAVGTALEVRGKPYPKGPPGKEVQCWPITAGNCASAYAGYYVPKANTTLGELCP